MKLQNIFFTFLAVVSFQVALIASDQGSPRNRFDQPVRTGSAESIDHEVGSRPASPTHSQRLLSRSNSQSSLPGAPDPEDVPVDGAMVPGSGNLDRDGQMVLYEPNSLIKYLCSGSDQEGEAYRPGSSITAEEAKKTGDITVNQLQEQVTIEPYVPITMPLNRPVGGKWNIALPQERVNLEQKYQNFLQTDVAKAIVNDWQNKLEQVKFADERATQEMKQQLLAGMVSAFHQEYVKYLNSVDDFVQKKYQERKQYYVNAHNKAAQETLNKRSKISYVSDCVKSILGFIAYGTFEWFRPAKKAAELKQDVQEAQEVVTREVALSDCDRTNRFLRYLVEEDGQPCDDCIRIDHKQVVKEMKAQSQVDAARNQLQQHEDSWLTRNFNWIRGVAATTLVVWQLKRLLSWDSKKAQKDALQQEADGYKQQVIDIENDPHTPNLYLIKYQAEGRFGNNMRKEIDNLRLQVVPPSIKRSVTGGDVENLGPERPHSPVNGPGVNTQDQTPSKGWKQRIGDTLNAWNPWSKKNSGR